MFSIFDSQQIAKLKELQSSLPNIVLSVLSQQKASVRVTSAHLAKCALHPTQKVVIAGPDAVSAMDVVDFKSQLLNLLKVVVQRENLGEHWVQVALDHFCPVQLRRSTHNKILNIHTLSSNAFKR